MSTVSVRERIPGILRERLSDAISQLAAAAALIVVFVFLSFASPQFLSSNNLFNLIVQASVVTVIAVGMTLVIITAGIDLSVGSVAALAGIIGVSSMVSLGFPPSLAILVGVLTGVATGLINGLLVSVANLNPFIATLGMLSAARGLTFVSSEGQAVFATEESFRLFGQGEIASIPVPIITLVLVAVAGHIVEDRGYAELAGSLHTSEAVVRQRVSRGLAGLRRRIGGRP